MSGGQQIHFSIRLGIYEIRTEDISPDQVLARADETLYRTKHLGRNRIAYL